MYDELIILQVNLAIKSLAEKYCADGVLISSHDEFLNEYVSNDRSLMYFCSNFNCSNGVMFFGKSTNILFTDGRYLTQAKMQLDPEIWEIIDFKKIDIKTKLQSIGIKKFVVVSSIFSAKKLLELSDHFTIIALHHRMIMDNLNIPINISKSDIDEYPIEYAGESSQSKIARISKKLECDAYFISDLASICWLLNIRGSDVPGSPLINCYAILDTQKQYVSVFGNFNEIIQHKYAEFLSMQHLTEKVSKIELMALSMNEINYHIYQMLLECCRSTIDIKNPILIPKSIKNETEIEFMKKAHEIDATAMKKLIDWVKNTTNINEYDIVTMAAKFRAENENFLYPSFETIAGFNENSAIIHYKAQKDSCKMIEQDGVLLIDSGGQYNFGTTDVTRTILLGNVSEKYPKVEFHYNLVQKSLECLSNLHFPCGTNGSQLDSIARHILWNEGLDYPHGTGHGVGSALTVHEGLCGISPKNLEVIEPGMILSIEPGIYIEGQYGIRLENLVLVVKSDKFDNFLMFETLTKI